MRDSGLHLRWPVERFYWAVLDGSLVPAASRLGARRLRQGLGYVFESVLPGIPIEEVHAIYQRLPGQQRRYLACAVPLSALEQEVPKGALSLSPESLPDFVTDAVDPHRLNLLTGKFLPGHLRGLRRRSMLSLALIALLCAVLLSFGSERRVRAVQQQVGRVVEAKLAVYEQVLGAEAIGGRLPTERLLTAELRTLERTRSSDAPVDDIADCSTVLSNLLARWPTSVTVDVQTLSIAPEAITVGGSVPAMEDVQRLWDAFQAMPGWRAEPPQSKTSGDRVTFTLSFKPHQEAP